MITLWSPLNQDLLGCTVSYFITRIFFHFVEKFFLTKESCSSLQRLKFSFEGWFIESWSETYKKCWVSWSPDAAPVCAPGGRWMITEDWWLQSNSWLTPVCGHHHSEVETWQWPGPHHLRLSTLSVMSTSFCLLYFFYFLNR